MEKGIVKDKRMSGFLVISRTPEGKVYLEIWVKSDNNLKGTICDSPDCGFNSSYYTIPRGGFTFCEKCFNDFKEYSMAFWIQFDDISVAGFNPKDYFLG